MGSDAKGGEERKAARGAEPSGFSHEGCIYASGAWIAKQLPIGHFLGHIQQQLAIFLVGFAQQAT